MLEKSFFKKKMLYKSLTIIYNNNGLRIEVWKEGRHA